LVGTLVDHMIALLVIGTVFVSAVVALPALSYVNLLSVDQQQLRNIALDTLKTMLQDAGYPADWGSTYDFDPDQVERFGLALSGGSSFYVLDPDKVQRLIVGNPLGFLGYEDIRAKLRLQGYGFTFRIVPPFKVIVNDEGFDGESKPITLSSLIQGVKVLVTNNAGSPIPIASVKTTLVYIVKNETAPQLVKATNTTDAVGRCIIKPDISSVANEITDFIIVFKVTVADLTSVSARYMAGFGLQRVINASIVGENVTLTIPEGPGWEKNSAGTRWVANLMSVSEDELLYIYGGMSDGKTWSNDAKISWGQGHWGWSRLFPGLSYYDTLFLIFSLSVPNPRQQVLVLGPEPVWRGFRVADCGGPCGASSIVKVQRSVIISGMAYIAELTMWKETP